MNDTTPMTIEELCRETERELARLGLANAQSDGRVTGAPDARAVRYYGTLGLLPRPQIVGRQATYDGGHVRRLIAIKALQLEGLPLAKIQERLFGRTDAELDALIAAVTANGKTAPRGPKPIVWRELALSPGLKLMAEANWTPPDDPAEIESLFRAALAALRAPIE